MNPAELITPDPGDRIDEHFLSKLAHFGGLIGSFWLTPAAFWSWVMLIILISVRFTTVYVGYLNTVWEKGLFDALQFRNAGALPSLFVMFGLLAASELVLLTIRTYFSDAIGFNWRQSLTNRYAGKWLDSGAYHRIERRGRIDNPDQRIAEDLNLVSVGIVQLFANLIGFVTGVITYSVLLWQMSDPLSFVFAGVRVSVHGYLVWAAVLFAVLSTWLIAIVGRRLVGLNISQQHYEADFRFGLIHVRRGAEQIAFYRGEEFERRNLLTRFITLRMNFFRRLRNQTQVVVASDLVGRIAEFLPILLVMPSYLQGGLTIGDVMQRRQMFLSLSSALAFFREAWIAIQELRATVRRIRTFDREMLRPDGRAIAIQDGCGTAGTVGLTLNRPNGERLLHLGDWHVAAGERWLVRGASGAGKSTLLRALAGIWPDGEGQIDRAVGRTMFVPQMPYMPIGPLRAALRFPLDPDALPDDEYHAMLELCGLGCHIGKLDVIDQWDRVLSPGEQQRIALARILLNRPAHLFLDEATSALDAAGARAFYQRLLELLPGVTIVSVAHTEELDTFHTHELVIRDGSAVARPLIPPDRTS